MKGLDYQRLDGKTSQTQRLHMVRNFNDSTNKQFRLLLISTKAGGLGINLTAACRCVLVDASWNPALDLQAIFRIFRLGQDQDCFVYRLISYGTMEDVIYSRSVTKEAMAIRVVDKRQTDRNYTLTELKELYVLKDPETEQIPSYDPPEDSILRQLLNRKQNNILFYHQHEAKLDNTQEPELTELEKSGAWKQLNASALELPSCSGTLGAGSQSIQVNPMISRYEHHVNASQLNLEFSDSD